MQAQTGGLSVRYAPTSTLPLHSTKMLCALSQKLIFEVREHPTMAGDCQEERQGYESSGASPETPRRRIHSWGLQQGSGQYRKRAIGEPHTVLSEQGDGKAHDDGQGMGKCTVTSEAARGNTDGPGNALIAVTVASYHSGRPTPLTPVVDARRARLPCGGCPGARLPAAVLSTPCCRRIRREAPRSRKQ